MPMLYKESKNNILLGIRTPHIQNRMIFTLLFLIGRQAVLFTLKARFINNFDYFSPWMKILSFLRWKWHVSLMKMYFLECKCHIFLDEFSCSVKLHLYPGGLSKDGLKRGSWSKLFCDGGRLWCKWWKEPGWQKLHGSMGGTRRKVWTGTKRRIWRKNCKYAFDENFHCHFCSQWKAAKFCHPGRH